MTKEEILAAAVYIQFPLTYKTYKLYSSDLPIHYLPLPPKGMMYDEWKGNENHFIQKYHFDYSMPLLTKLLNLSYEHDDFHLVEKAYEEHTFSILFPKTDFKFELFGFDRDEYLADATFEDLIQNDKQSDRLNDYHRLYRYSHECSRIVNKTIDSDRKLLISGDSQMIPLISWLACLFKELWYFDNRPNKSKQDILNDASFSDVLIELNCNSLKKYCDDNFS